ncbi:MAG: hypothetical protein IJ341_12545 [Bacteroidales bacterium]|nr:hypothetical protein [Bacteroidales bacterium]
MKTKGDSGNDITQVIGDKITFVGADNANVLPSCRKDGAGISKVNIETSATQGVMKLPSSFTEYQAIDNAGDHHTGNYVIVALNRLALQSGGGGIEIHSGGNINIVAAGGLCNIIPAECALISSNQVKINSFEATILKGKELYIQTERTQFINTVKMDKNLVVNGSAMINGELYVKHITGPINAYPTSMEPALPVYFYPNFNLKGICKFTYNGAPVSTEGGPACPPNGEMTITITLSKDSYEKVHGYTSPHRHQSIHIGADLKASPDEIWKDAEVINGNTAIPAKKNIPFGDAIENVKDNTIEIVTNALTDTLSQAYSSVF